MDVGRHCWVMTLTKCQREPFMMFLAWSVLLIGMLAKQFSLSITGTFHLGWLFSRSRRENNVLERIYNGGSRKLTAAHRSHRSSLLESCSSPNSLLSLSPRPPLPPGESAATAKTPRVTTRTVRPSTTPHFRHHMADDRCLRLNGSMQWPLRQRRVPQRPLQRQVLLRRGVHLGSRQPLPRRIEHQVLRS